MRYLAVEFRIHVEVRIHKIELHTADIYTPHVRVDDAARIWHFEHHRQTVFSHHLVYRKPVEALRLIIGYLLPVH